MFSSYHRSRRRIFDRTLHVLESIIIVVTFLSITLLAFANVVSRYVLNQSISFTGELVVNIAALLTLVGAAAVVREGSHPGFNLLRDSSSGLVQKISISFVSLMMVVFYGVFLWLGLDMVLSQAGSGRTTPALGIPQWAFSLAIPFGSLVGGARTIQVWALALRNPDVLAGEEQLAIEHAAEEEINFEKSQEARGA